MRTIYWQPALLRRIALDRHGVIEADAGTGKTYTLAHLIVTLLLEGVELDRVLAVTFTEKATAELRGRIRGTLEELAHGEDGAAVTGAYPIALDEVHRQRLQDALLAYDRAQVFTVHAFCQRVLSQFAFDCGLRFDLQMTDRGHGFHRAFRTLLRQRFALDDEPRQLLEEWLAGDDYRHDLEALEQLLFDAWRGRYQPEANSGAGLARRIVDSFLPEVARHLEHEKRRRGEVDYDDMLAWVWKALEGPRGTALGAALRQRYRYALVDEFQDTDDLQWQIFRRLFVESEQGNVLIVVGDPKQAIYGFRGADVFTYLKARAELAAGEPVKLVDNYRSTVDLIAACNCILDDRAPKPVLDGDIRYDSPAVCMMLERRATAGGGPTRVAPVTVLSYAGVEGQKGTADNAKAAIGNSLAHYLHDLLYDPRYQITIEEADGRRRTVLPGDVFVLTRTRTESAEVGQYLRAAGVPFAFYKLDGLYQTQEARFVLDILRAIEAPDNRTYRLRAWMSPFFGLQFGMLAAAHAAPAAHPLYERLYRWQAMAREERYAELFASLLGDSGLLEQRLFTADSPQELGNYRQIFEALLGQALARRLSLAELIELLSDYVSERAMPPGDESNFQRLSETGAAVSVMTVHMSKGLEADVVALYGGMYQGHSQESEVAVYHQGLERRFAIGQDELKETKPARDREGRDEDRRLLYVALTRARAMLCLPYFPAAMLQRRPNGFYAALNDRLEEILARRAAQAPDSELHRLFAVVSAAAPPPSSHDADLAAWQPPPQLLDASRDGYPAGYFDRLRREHAPLVMRSYTRLQAWREPDAWTLQPEDFKDDAQASDETDLAGGRAVGIWLHETLERVDFEPLRNAPPLAAWKERPEVQALLRQGMARWAVRDSQWIERGAQLVHSALTSILALPDGRRLGPICRARCKREMEFLFPIPESGHPLLALRRDGRFTVDRGYFKGFVDLVFEEQERIYVADWKSDQLRSYDHATLAAHVKRHYELQALIYTTGIVRWLKVRDESDYQARFGGLLFLFLRGLGGADPRHGIYPYRPPWEEVCRAESSLMELGGPPAS